MNNKYYYSFSQTSPNQLLCAAHMVLHYVKTYHIQGSNYHAVIAPKQVFKRLLMLFHAV